MAVETQKKEKSGYRGVSKILILILILLILSLSLYGLNRHQGIVIREARMVTGVDKNMRPVKITNFFPKNTSKVSAWINWRNAKINTQLLVRWHYVTDDVPIYDYNLNIPKKEGVANIMLSMPEGKTLPSGSYKVTILSRNRPLIKPLSFEVQ